MSSNQIDIELFNETDVIKSLKSKCVESEPTESSVKSNRGRKRKYASDEERIIARRAQQKAYRERKKNRIS